MSALFYAFDRAWHKRRFTTSFCEGNYLVEYVAGWEVLVHHENSFLERCSEINAFPTETFVLFFVEFLSVQMHFFLRESSKSHDSFSWENKLNKYS